MTEEKRQLLAIMFTDIVGYTAMMGKSEPRALETLRRNRDLHRRLIAEHRGSYLQEIGDGTMASFESAVDAVRCALALQGALRDDPGLTLRIGIHSGDVITRGGDVVGDAVNVASRIEDLAAPGGVSISGSVFESIRNRPDIEAVFLGAKSLKNVSEPVRVYGLTGEGLPNRERILEVGGSVHGAPASPARRRRLVAATLLAGALLVLLAGLYTQRRAGRTASESRMAYPLPDKPSIVVLPFDNMGGDPEDDLFGDGLTEDIITGLSKVPGLFVIARNTSFTYKDRAVKVQQVSEDLGVRYVLEGSVRRSEGTVRITVQLIDALTGHHIWAEKYDREIRGVFSLIDEITIEIMTALQVNVTEGEYAGVFSRGTDNLAAYEKLLKGSAHTRAFNRNDNLIAKAFFEEAIALDPGYPIAHAFLGRTHYREAQLGSSKDKRQSIQTAIAHVRRAIELDESLAWAHGYMGWLLTVTKRYDEARKELDLAVSLDPNSSENLGWLGFLLNYLGQRDEAIAVLKKALRLNPLPPPIAYLFLGVTYRDAGRYEDAIETCGKILPLQPDFEYAHTCLASAYSLLGRGEEARAEASEVLRINPEFKVSNLARQPYRNPDDLERLLSSLRAAGLPG